MLLHCCVVVSCVFHSGRKEKGKKKKENKTTLLTFIGSAVSFLKRVYNPFN